MIGKKGLFGKAGMPGVISGYGGGTFNMDGMQVTPSMPQEATVQDGARLGVAGTMPERGGFFGQGGVGRAIAGSIGDMLLQQSGAAPIFGPQQQMQQMMAFRQAEEQRRRAEQLADFRTQMQIRQQFETPEKDAFDRALSNAGIDPQSEQGVALYRQRAQTLAQGQPQEPRMVTLPDGRAVFGTMDEIRGILGGGAQGSTGQQVLGQSLPQGWTIEGGAGGNASGNFR
jgi:hypothetical protein